MIILAIRTDKPEAEIGLFDGQTQLAYRTWTAHRQLAETIHATIDEVLRGANRTLKDIEGIVCYKGPGSFTGLRIGLTVGNAVAYAGKLPIVAADGEQWRTNGIDRLLRGESDTVTLPEYGSSAFTTKQKK